MAPLLSPSVVGEELYLYLALTPHAVSSALIREEDKVQKPVYYTSKALRGADTIAKEALANESMDKFDEI